MSEDSKNLLTWFGKRKENIVTNGMNAHAIAVLDCVIELRMAMEAMASDNGSEAKGCVQRLIGNERKADALEDSLCEQLSTGNLSPQEREDLLHFVRKTDSIANWCKESALFIQVIADTRIAIPTKVWNSLVEICTILRSEVDALLNCIKLFGSSTGNMVACIDDVKEQEQRIDMAYFDVTKQIYMEIDDVKAVMLVSRVLEAMEMAADTCKGCADTISILMAARRP